MKEIKWRKALAVLFAFVLCFGDVGGYVKTAEAANDTNSAVAPNLTTVNDCTETTAMALAKLLVGDSMEIKSAKMIGNTKSFGSFKGAYDSVGFDEGIVLSTGFVTPNDKSIFEQGYQMGASSDLTPSDSTTASPLDKNGEELKGFKVDEGNYYDATILEFTVVPKSDSLSFQYAVASDEYPEYISNYWDQFILTVNEVNTPDNEIKNYAWVPNTDGTNSSIPVTIGTINHKNNSQYYRGIQDNTDSENAISSDHFVYDGITKVFSVNAPVTSGKEYVIRLAIADYKDSILDSAVFVKAGSVQDKQPLYGLIDIAYVDSESKDIFLRRKGGYNSAVSAEIVFTDDKGNPIEKKTVEFPDGSYMNIVKAPNNAVHAHLTNPTGAAQVVSAVVDIDNWVSATALKTMKTKVNGTVYELKDGEKVPAEDAKVTYKTADGQEFDTKTNAKGKYTLYNVPGGKCNITVSSKDGKKETVGYAEITIYDIAKLGRDEEPIILEKKISLDNSSSKNTVIIGGLSEAAKGNEISATVNAVKFSDSSNKELIANGIESMGGENFGDSKFDEGLILDISLTSDGIDTKELEKPILITVQIPDNMKGKADYYLYHIHNGKPEILYDLDNDPDTITVQVNKLSEFALFAKGNDNSGKFESSEMQQIGAKLESAKQKEQEQINNIITNIGNSNDQEKPSEDDNTNNDNNNENNNNQDNNNQDKENNNQNDNNNQNNNQNNNNTNDNQNNSSSSSSSSSSNSSASSNVNVTHQLREKIFEGVKVEQNKILYKGDSDIIEISGVQETTVPISYKSKDPKTVTIDKDGNVKAKKAGETTIVTEIMKDGVSKKYETKVTVKKACIEIVSGKSKVKKGKTTTFKAEVRGSDAKVTWSVSNKKLATINKKTGKLKAKNTGTVTVYAKAGSLKKSYKVKIVK